LYSNKKKMIKHKRSSISIPKSCVMLDVAPMMAKRNIYHPYTFLLKNGFNPNTANKILKNKAVQINFRQLTTLCMVLDCTPNDLFKLRELTPPQGHALEQLVN